MLAKILMCSCYWHKFLEAEHDYVSKLCHFKWKCKDDHRMFVLSCKQYPFVIERLTGMDQGCKCATLGAYESRTFCSQVR